MFANDDDNYHDRTTTLTASHLGLVLNILHKFLSSKFELQLNKPSINIGGSYTTGFDFFDFDFR